MDYHCCHCGEDLDGGDIYEYFLAETANPVKALKIAAITCIPSFSFKGITTANLLKTSIMDNPMG